MGDLEQQVIELELEVKKKHLKTGCSYSSFIFAKSQTYVLSITPLLRFFYYAISQHNGISSHKCITSYNVFSVAKEKLNYIAKPHCSYISSVGLFTSCITSP